MGEGGEPAVRVERFRSEHWGALWQVRAAQLAEGGIVIAPADLPAGPRPVKMGDYEWDFHRMDEVFLRGGAGFWLAWHGVLPVGYVGAQDLGGVAELRRMYVRAEYRRLGIGTALVRQLSEHCRACGLWAIELWTGPQGTGPLFYPALGFRRVAGPGPGFERAPLATGYWPGADELRLRLELAVPQCGPTAGRG